jgi:hypothetical protein
VTKELAATLVAAGQIVADATSVSGGSSVAEEIAKNGTKPLDESVTRQINEKIDEARKLVQSDIKDLSAEDLKLARNKVQAAKNILSDQIKRQIKDL